MFMVRIFLFFLGIILYFQANLSDPNIDLYNINSGYYNDICYTYTTENGTDIVVKDRQIEYVNNNPIVLVSNFSLYKSEIPIKQERKTNQNIPDNLIRHQFMMLLVKIAKDKYFRTKQIPSVPESVQYAFEHNYNSYLMPGACAGKPKMKWGGCKMRIRGFEKINKYKE